MATARKKWFRVATSILREPWDNDTLAFSIRLMAWLQDRWARDGLSPEEGCRALIGPAQLCALAGCQSVVRARSIARRLTIGTSCTIDARGADTWVQWSKYSDFQQFSTRNRPENAPSVSVSVSAPAKKKKNDLEDSVDAVASLDPEKLVNLLGQEPGTKSDKIAWLKTELPMIELLAMEDHPTDAKRRMAAVKSRVLRHWRQHQKPQAAPGSTISGRPYLRRVQERDRSETTQEDIDYLHRVQAEIREQDERERVANRLTR